VLNIVRSDALGPLDAPQSASGKLTLIVMHERVAATSASGATTTRATRSVRHTWLPNAVPAAVQLLACLQPGATTLCDRRRPRCPGTSTAADTRDALRDPSLDQRLDTAPPDLPRNSRGDSEVPQRGMRVC
jgi:hypothetical protein